MRILGIETSCDETSAAVVEETGDAAKPWAIRSNVVASQVPIHREWGGVVPELASRQHIRDICGVVERALDEAEHDVDATSAPSPSRKGPASSGRCSSACRSPRPRRRPPACRWSPSITSPATSSRWCCRTASCRCRRSSSSCRAATPACISSSSPAIPAAQPHARRCGGRGVRQGGEAARPRLSGRAGDRSAARGPATTARSRCRRRG